jgi:predicted Ser/Thr protein kinase
VKDGPHPRAPTAPTVRAMAPQPAEPAPELAVGSDPGAQASGQPGCPGDDTLVALVEKALDGDRVAALADHVDRCERCRATVGALAGSDEPAMARHVGRYELREQLGSGGMGVVWSAWDPMLERRVAIKLLRPEVGDAGSARMLREARAAAKLAHPNVVAVHDVGEHAGAVFIATELVEGESLDRWQREKSATEIVEIYVQACRGLAAAHAIGIVHRDVKPSNILVGRDGRARIGDFGLARASAIDGEAALTHTGHVVGTPAYMAPEQRAALPVDARADQYALCVALAEALGGTRPGPETPAAKLRVEPRYAAAIARGLRIDPDERWPDLGAFVAALIAEPTPAAPRHRARVWIAGGAVVVAAAAVAIVIGMRTDSATSGSEGGGGDTLVAGGPKNNSQRRSGGSGTDHGSASGTDHGSASDTGSGSGSGNGSGSASDTGSGSGSGSGNGSGSRRGKTTPRAGAGSSTTAAAPGPTNPSIPQGSQVAEPAWTHYVEGMQRVNTRNATCRVSFAAFDAARGVRPAQITAREDTLARARCELIAGNCTAGAARITALYTTEGLSAPTIADEVGRETRMLCPTTPSIGTWQERLQRLLTQAPLLQNGSLSELTTALAHANAIIRDAKGKAAMSNSERIDLSTTVLWIAAGFARFDGHCADARRARALSDYAPIVMTDALSVCLTTSNP